MIHITLNTGHSHVVQAESISTAGRDAVRPLLAAGGPIPGFAPFRLTVGHQSGALSMAIFRGREPITLSAVCWQSSAAAEVWAGLERVYFDLSERAPRLIVSTAAPECPATLPWLATLLLPATVAQRPETLLWIPDFTQVLAFVAAQARP